MLVSRIGAALLAVLAIAACSPKPTAAANAATPTGPTASADGSSITIALGANQQVTRIVPLPPGTHKVSIKTGAAGFACDHLAFVTGDGGRSNNFTDASVPANLNMSDSTASGSYVSADIQCRGGPTASELVLTPSL